MVAVDTNILVYAESLGEVQKQDTARRVLRRVRRADLVMPAQVLAELFRVLRAKAKLPAAESRERLAIWEGFALVAPTATTTIESALDLASEHDFQIFDAIILAASAEAGCRMLLSEDMQDGFVWRGVTIVNPFAATPTRYLSISFADEPAPLRAGSLLS
ncbi:PIN domain-containing protein [uncultured Enterovirga sp.]|uniref:PIN domain-containing protein n=1 Tax=uncultured Enterovirga sp. TaxID=2026352 RepID=UPI0035CB7FEA